MLGFVRNREYCGLLGAGDALALRMLEFVGSRGCCGFEDSVVFWE